MENIQLQALTTFNPTLLGFHSKEKGARNSSHIYHMTNLSKADFSMFFSWGPSRKLMYGADKITESKDLRIKHTEDGADKPNTFPSRHFASGAVQLRLSYNSTDLVLLNQPDDGHNLTSFRIGCDSELNV